MLWRWLWRCSRLRLASSLSLPPKSRSKTDRGLTSGGNGEVSDFQAMLEVYAQLCKGIIRAPTRLRPRFAAHAPEMAKTRVPANRARGRDHRVGGDSQAHLVIRPDVARSGRRP